MGKAQNEIKTSEALSGAKKAISETAYLKERLEHLQLALQGIWELLRDKNGLTDADLREKMHTLELALAEDENSEAVPCSACGRPISNRRKICLYCGTKKSDGSPI